ncbi:DNA-3-methyladenine glycosylase [hydrothermal vent metagenome]|uniref:DNA-3-methyladenine glycosylase n=1 Tax=hydrothermal vent metagenome TaxID=652676 RepID=A0A3B0SZD5_9ZZZZ
MTEHTYADGRPRCGWHGTDPLYVAYHDEEWGVPEYDDRALFEKLILDGFQAGLSWITILRKRDTFRSAFADFAPERIARFTDTDVERLMADTGIVRNRAKINATIGGAKVWLDMQETGPGFSSYVWDFVDGAPIRNTYADWKDAPAATDISTVFSKDLKGRGFKFCGPTIVYAFMQAVGMVNDHQTGCFRHEECAALARKQG